ncbi:hypothetical protein TNCV_2851121 [Trichonephila clavipes]|nr:hypothetical protein TNCV_2851121 [Trichonephila clavipes]
MPDSYTHNQELTISELIEVHELEQDIEELSSLHPVQSEDRKTIGNLTGGLNLIEKGIPGAIFQQDDAGPHVAKTVRDFCSAQHMQLLPWPAYSLIEHVWDLVGRRLARYPRPAASKDELLLRIQAILNSLPQADVQNLFDSMPRRIAALIAARGGYTKY